MMISSDSHSSVLYSILLPPPCFAADLKVSLPPTHVPDFTWTTEKRKTLLSLLAIIPLLGFHLPVISTTYIAEVYANEYYVNYSFLDALSYVRVGTLFDVVELQHVCLSSSKMMNSDGMYFFSLCNLVWGEHHRMSRLVPCKLPATCLWLLRVALCVSYPRIR